jgi:hypothetical protein
MICKKCGDEFELKPNKPGFANVCEDCTGLHRATPLPKPAAPAPQKNIWTAAQELLASVEAIDGRPDPILRAMIQPLRSLAVNATGRRKRGTSFRQGGAR